jgi:hypothetical protein
MTDVKPPFSAVLTGALLLGVAVTTWGCRQESEQQESGAQSSVADPPSTPQQSFNHIVKEFSRAIETGQNGVPSGFLIRGQEGHSRLTFENKVTSQFIPPEVPDDVYRGVITVTSRTNYFLQKFGSPDSQNEEASNGTNRTAEEMSFADDQGMEILDEELVTSSDTPPRDDSSAGDQEDVVARRSDEVVSEYVLLYKNGRWVLNSKLDPETERAVANAFDHVLSSQP